MSFIRRGRLAIAVAALLTASSPLFAAENVMLVLDASGSMWGQIDGRSKIEIAREATGKVVSDWDPANQIGLIAYGHRRKGDCSDIETLIPLGPLEGDVFMDTVNALNPKGMTPLSQAVIDAAAALKSSEQKATVILVSDGEETCKLDPCAVGAELEKSGVDFTAHVIGFDVQNPAHQAQLRCLAENTGGRYFNARDAQELSTAVQGAMKASTQPPPPPATATLKPTGQAVITQLLAVEWSGPADEGDYITVVLPDAPDGAYLTYAYVPEAEGDGSGEVSFEMPATAGDYELRYISPSREQQVLARAPLPIGDLEAMIEAPETAVAGTTLIVTARGPKSGSHWVGFARPGGGPGDFIANHYARLPEQGDQLEIKVPAELGDYELRFVLNEAERVAYSRPIKVVEAETMVDGPAEVMAGDRVRIQASGPVDGSHWIGFAPAGGDPGAYVSNAYFRPEAASGSGMVTAPFEAGDYEYRYVLFEGEKVVASKPVKVLPAKATLNAPASAAVYTEIDVGFTGPRADSNWIGIVPVGGDGSEYKGWSYVPAEGDSVRFYTPEEAGDWEVVFVQNNQVLARQPISVQ
ncbi:MAG: VWA domain-containing protein [Rhodanobacteraceae bacterium]|nr:VWA domain-containing protein [Xanthomonadales bacterium]MCP5478693.1 VWA domain-containing protein [Rhodanobacteraceae bacterium]HPF72054.1 VWA domain-containing protein [Xanthomonadaceae bacterium]HRX98795.1 VWA domain-containing protein [Xanthomonadaceae bacterium]